MSKEKDTLRQKIASLKKEHSLQILLHKSEEVFSVLEITGEFQKAKNIFIYNSMDDEVSTRAFVDRWKAEKNFYFPVVVGDALVFRLHDDEMQYKTSSFGISEPIAADFTDYKKIDLIVVPGVAFDRKMNRMGRGKGYYDRFLPNLKAIRVGVCFDFQLLDDIPNDSNDVKMDMIVSENDLIW